MAPSAEGASLQAGVISQPGLRPAGEADWLDRQGCAKRHGSVQVSQVGQKLAELAACT